MGARTCGQARRIGGRLALAGAALAWLAGCAAGVQPIPSDKAGVEYKTQVYRDLVSLPPPPEPIVISVYRFRDDTGQYKPGTGTTGWSTAVTQGATPMLIKVLRDAGKGRWFTVLEREHLADLLNERKIIRQTRQQYGEDGADGGGERLPPLLFAPLLLMGGIVGYESDLLTGGVGARYLGIGGHTEYRRDTVTVYLRAVSVKNGRIVESVMTNKTIMSIGITGGAFKFVSFKSLLEVEAGFTSNEPPQMAVLEAIEKAVFSLVMEGVVDGLWRFRDAASAQPLVDAYLIEKGTGTGGAADASPPADVAAAAGPTATATGVVDSSPPAATTPPVPVPAAPPLTAPTPTAISPPVSTPVVRAPQAAPPRAEPAARYEALAHANVRAGPGTEHPVVGRLLRGARITVIAPGPEWDRVAWPGGGSAWVHASLLARDASAAPAATGWPRTFVTTSDVIVRVGPDREHGRREVIGAETLLLARGEAGGWYRIRLQSGRDGYVHGANLAPVE